LQEQFYSGMRELHAIRPKVKDGAAQASFYKKQYNIKQKLIANVVEEIERL